MTGFVPVMWAVWGLMIVFLAAVSLYVSRLGRDEEDQIFLSEGFDQEKSQQAAIAAKLAKVQPLKKLALGLVVVMTVVVAGYYILDVIKQFQ